MRILNKQILLSAALPFLALVPAQVAAQTVGVNAAVRNNVQMTSQANPAMHKAIVKERVGLGNDITSGPASALQILLLDRTSFTVGANARVKIDRFVYDPSRSSSVVGASVVKGAFRFMSGKATHANPGQSSINTPVASIGIRGTIVEGVVGEDALRIAKAESGITTPNDSDAGTASLIVLRGPGQQAQGGETPGAIDVSAGGSSVAIERAGLAVFVPGPNQAPIGPFMLSDAGLAALQALLMTTPSRRAAGNSPWVANPIIDWVFESSEERGQQTPFDPIGP